MMTSNDKTKPLNAYLEQMWHDYCQLNTEAFTIYNLLMDNDEIVQNDHIALRTFNHPKFGIKSLAKHFLKYGYTESGEYFFTEKKLYAKHYENINPEMPKIFISELELEKVSPFVQQTLSKIADLTPVEKIDHENFVYGGRHWPIDFSTYERLAEESEYASWVYAYGFRPNHFTVSINHLKKLNDIQTLNTFIKKNGFKLNTFGGEIKGSATELLEQSSTMAGQVNIQFSDGTHSIPACYYEFAKRYPMKNGHLYQGFIAKSADKIFESTNKNS